jgi:S1-C subfamily serine protease
VAEQFLPCPTCDGAIPIETSPQPGDAVVCPCCNAQITPIPLRDTSRRRRLLGIAIAIGVALSMCVAVAVVLIATSSSQDDSKATARDKVSKKQDQNESATLLNAGDRVSEESLATLEIEPLLKFSDFKYEWQPNETYLYEVRIGTDLPVDGFDKPKRRSMIYGINEYTVLSDEQANISGLTAFDEGEQLGSAFVIHPDGYLLTNAHLLIGAEHIHVSLSGKEYEAKIVQVKRDSDLAVLRIDAKGLAALPIDKSQRSQQTEDVRVLGFKFGEAPAEKPGTIAGILSGFEGRFFQLDVPVNSAHDGGPVVNQSGRVIGILTRGIPSAGLLEVTLAAELANAYEVFERFETIPSAAEIKIDDLSKAVGALRITRGPKGLGLAKRYAFKCRSYLRWSDQLYRKGANSAYVTEYLEPKVATIVVDEYGRLLSESSSNELPFLLGSVWTLPFEQLAPDGDAQLGWTDDELVLLRSSEATETLRVLNQPLMPKLLQEFFQLEDLGRILLSGSKPKEEVEAIPALSSTSFEVEEPRLGLSIVEKTRTLEILGDPDDGFTFETSESGHFVFDREKGLLEGQFLKVEYSLKNGESTYELPISVSSRRLDARDPGIAALEGGAKGLIDHYSLCEKAYTTALMAKSLSGTALLDIEPIFLLRDHVVLMARLYSRSTKQRTDSIRLLGKWGGPEQLPEIMRYANNTEYLPAVTQALALMKHEAAIPELIKVVRAYGEDAIKHLDTAAYEEALLRLSDVGQLRISRPAHQKLKLVGNVKSVDFVQARLMSYPEKSEVRKDALQLLRDLGSRASRDGDIFLLERLTRGLEDDEPTTDSQIEHIIEFLDRNYYSRYEVSLRCLERLRVLKPKAEKREKVKQLLFKYLRHPSKAQLRLAALRVFEVWGNEPKTAEYLFRWAKEQARSPQFGSVALKAAKAIQNRSEQDGNK